MVDREHEAHAQRQAHAAERGSTDTTTEQRLPCVQRRQQQGEDGSGQHDAGRERHQRRFLQLAHALHQKHGQGAHRRGQCREQRSLHARRHGAAGAGGVPPDAGGRPEGAARRQPRHQQQAGTEREQGVAQRVRWHRQLQALHLQPHGLDLADEGGHGGLLAGCSAVFSTVLDG
ncbi:hypothetical protein D9M69_604130 [compost metagenome]